MVIFLDTYAIVAIDTNNPSYRKYVLDSTDAATTIFNLSETYFVYLKKFGQKEADEIYEVVRGMVVPIDDSIIKKAMKFKLVNLKKRFSFADCIGYVAALKLNAKFITGDYAFKGLENVEFVR
ncbi:PIN domain-containing protein [Candidatus Woesearchaeota archaeon]|nr:PIN domain-containing protein [Candidatus Woesearchaeota archaeon]